MRDAQTKKRRDLRRRARSAQGVENLFEAYHPECKEPHWRDRYSNHVEWERYYNARDDWKISLGGYWNALGGAPPSSYRRGTNRLLRARQTAALRRAVRDNTLEDLVVPSHVKDLRWYYW